MHYLCSEGRKETGILQHVVAPEQREEDNTKFRSVELPAVAGNAERVQAATWTHPPETYTNTVLL